MARIRRSKKMRKAIRELVGLAHERELSAALSELEDKFKAWHAGEIDCFDLNDEIHQHHNGISRTLWSKYQGDSEMILEIVVAQGVIEESEVPDELLAAIKRSIESFRRLHEDLP